MLADMNEKIAKCIEILGSQAKLAGVADVSQSLVSSWLNDKKPITPESVLLIEQAVQGKVTRHDLRPDLYPRATA